MFFFILDLKLFFELLCMPCFDSFFVKDSYVVRLVRSMGGNMVPIERVTKNV